MSIPRSLVVVAGAFSRAPHGPDNGAECESRRRTADHSYHGAREPCAHPSPHRLRTSLWWARPSPPQSGHSQITALRRCRSSSLLLLLFLGEGLAQLLLLLLWQVGRDDLEVVLPEFVDDPVRCRRPAGQGEQRRGSLRDLLAHLLDEVFVDSDVSHRARECAHAGPPAAPRNGTKKISPNRKPQKAPLIAPAPPMLCSSRVLGFLLP